MTYRCADSLPANVLSQLAAERDAIERSLITGTRPPNATEAATISKLYGFRLDSYLDRGYGACSLRDERVAHAVLENWMHFDTLRYQLFAWCVMPNHVHLVLRVFEGITIDRLFHSWKSYTSNVANRILGREGPFWQREYHDRIIRDEREFADTVAYVVRNPDSVGLAPWPFVGAKLE
jgi:REP element-mobilizing transposase RayT